MAGSGERDSKKRGPRGGIKHQPGRGHDTKSTPQKRKRFRRKAARKRKEKIETARKLWQEYDALSEETKRLLGPKGKPTVPRPSDENKGPSHPA